ncbi:hypothetical protein [Chryseobacterium salviniae]|uniref:Lipoprotein n=1 Tax=Chryseobacterium salviniae TaxID=3101750 RepID=A0ABU6HR13_9FLAO|nr:hypothetical protein [Chryseobacterium sp. T9W2-O]MEC3875479.1 hypothetical protein [Chryseobacterium sp. T9W2-O]
MYKLFFKLSILLFGFTLFSCKENRQTTAEQKQLEAKSVVQAANFTVAESSKKAPENIAHEISFDIVSPFRKDDNENCYVHGATKLFHKTDNSFMLTKKDFAITDVDFSDSNYEGPGYTIYSYQSSANKNMEVIIIEGQADIGTAWYYVVVLDGEDLVDKFYVKEPRANSETTDMKDFINVALKDKDLVLKFKKDKIARYSKPMANMRAEGSYLCLDKKIK